MTHTQDTGKTHAKHPHAPTCKTPTLLKQHKTCCSTPPLAWCTQKPKLDPRMGKLGPLYWSGVPTNCCLRRKLSSPHTVHLTPTCVGFPQQKSPGYDLPFLFTHTCASFNMQPAVYFLGRRSTMQDILTSNGCLPELVHNRSTC
jgi:hypothetical protein